MISKIKSYLVAAFVLLVGVSMLPTGNKMNSRLLDFFSDVVLSVFVLAAIPYVVLKEK